MLRLDECHPSDQPLRGPCAMLNQQWSSQFLSSMILAHEAGHRVLSCPAAGNLRGDGDDQK
jgi:hypothetical protein